MNQQVDNANIQPDINELIDLVMQQSQQKATITYIALKLPEKNFNLLKQEFIS